MRISKDYVLIFWKTLRRKSRYIEKIKIFLKIREKERGKNKILLRNISSEKNNQNKSLKQIDFLVNFCPGAGLAVANSKKFFYFF